MTISEQSSSSDFFAGILKRFHIECFLKKRILDAFSPFEANASLLSKYLMGKLFVKKSR